MGRIIGLRAGFPRPFFISQVCLKRPAKNVKVFQGDEFDVTTKPDALFLDVTLTSSSPGAMDLDLDLRTEDGQLVATSGSEFANGHFTIAVGPNKPYFVRVLG